MARKRNARNDGPPAARWAPEGTLTIDTVAEHWGRLRPLLGEGGGLVIDLAAVTRVDTAGVQLLVMARRAREARGQAIEVGHLPLPADTCALLGVSEEAAVAAAAGKD